MAELFTAKGPSWSDGTPGTFDRLNGVREWMLGPTQDEHDREAFDRASLHGIYSLSTSQLRTSLEAYRRENSKLKSERDMLLDRVSQFEAYCRDHRASMADNDALKLALEAELKQAKDLAARARMREELCPELAKELAPAAPKKAPVLFKDHLGRLYKFPFEMCETWLDMRSLIWHAYDRDPRLQACVGDEEAYDLVGPDGEIILQQYWREAVRPGVTIRLRFWAEPPPEPSHAVLDLDDILNPRRHDDDDDDDDEEDNQDDDDKEDLETYDIVSLDDILGKEQGLLKGLLALEE